MMLCVELSRRVVRVGLEQIVRLPYREYGRRLRWSILTWVCRELMTCLEGDDQWDGFPTQEPVDAIATFAALKHEADYKWPHFVVYLTWLTRTLGPERAYCTWQTLEQRYLKDLPSLLELTVRLLLTKTCRSGRTAAVLPASPPTRIPEPPVR